MCSLVRLASPGIGGDDLLIYLGNDSFCTSIPSPYLVLIEFKRATVLVRMLKYMSLTWNCELETDNIEGAQFRQRRTIQAKAHNSGKGALPPTERKNMDLSVEHCLKSLGISLLSELDV